MDLLSICATRAPHEPGPQTWYDIEQLVSKFRCITSKGPPKQLLEGHADVEYAQESFTISRLFRLSFFQSLFGDSICRKRCSLQWLCHVERNGCAWMCIDVNGASEAVIDMNHFFSGSFYRVVPCKECDWNNCSRTQSALNPTWPRKMVATEGHNHTLPNGYRMVLAWTPSQPSLSLMVSFRFLLLRLICLVNSIHLHTTYGCKHMQNQGFDNMSGWIIIFRMSSLGRFCYFKIEIRSASQEILKYVLRRKRYVRTTPIVKPCCVENGKPNLLGGSSHLVLASS